MTPSVANSTGAMSALAAAVLFGVSAPCAKLLLPGTGPLMLAALLYLGGGLGLAVVTLISGGRQTGGATAREAPLRGTDFLLLLAVIGSGHGARRFSSSHRGPRPLACARAARA